MHFKPRDGSNLCMLIYIIAGLCELIRAERELATAKCARKSAHKGEHQAPHTLQYIHALYVNPHHILYINAAVCTVHVL